MPIDLPSSALEVEERSKTDIERDLPGSDPFLKNSFLGAIATSNANRVFDFYGQLNLLQTLLMPDTATDQFLERWAAIYGLQRLAATKATGNVIAGGTPASNIPMGTLFTASNGETYVSTGTVAIAAQSPTVTSITRSGNVAIVITSTPHNLATNITPTISGAIQSEYNISNLQILNIPNATTFTYEVSGSPTTPATGTISLTYNSATIPIESQNFQNSANNVNVNLESGSTLNLQSPIVGVDNSVGVGFTAIGGGSDQETNEQLRVRLLNRIQDPVAHFNSADIIRKAREVAGVTRVFVQEVTPAVGQVTIYFMRDNDSDPIPDAGEVTTVRNSILEIKPANTATASVIVAAPTAVPVNFSFTSLNPNTASMQAAVSANLQQFFSEETQVGVNIQEDAYRAAIQNTIDTENGSRVVDFNLSAPGGDIVIGAGSIGTLGTVTYP